MDRDSARADYAPAALCLCLAKGRPHARVGFCHAAGMGDLIEAVRRGHGPNLNRLKQDLMAWVAGAQIGLSHWLRDVF